MELNICLMVTWFSLLWHYPWVWQALTPRISQKYPVIYMINTDLWLLTAAQQGLSHHRDSAIESSRYRRGSRGGEMGEFSPPLFLSPPSFSFFLIPQILNVHKQWLVLPINLFISSPQTHCPACNPKTPRFHALATLRCRRPGQNSPPISKSSIRACGSFT